MIILTIAEFFLYYLMLAGVLEVAFVEAMQPLITDMSNSMRFVIEYYAPTIMDMLVFGQHMDLLRYTCDVELHTELYFRSS